MGDAENPANRFTAVKVFSATMAQERDHLGEKITAWLREHLGDKITTWLRDNPGVTIVDKIVTQSSDEAFHCVAITLFYTEDT